MAGVGGRFKIFPRFLVGKMGIFLFGRQGFPQCILDKMAATRSFQSVFWLTRGGEGRNEVGVNLQIL